MKGVIIESSLKDTSILNEAKVLRTWEDESWILREVEIARELAEKFGAYLDDGPWYVHFWEEGSDEVLVVFKDHVFSITHSDQSTWKTAIEYGKSIGIPEEQLDFLLI
jgi:hypothetical protein